MPEPLTHDPEQIDWFNTAFILTLPAIAIASTAWYVATIGLGWQEVVAAVLFWFMTGLGITAGYHRLFAHRTYKAPRVTRWVFAMLGAAAAQNSVIAWASDHRRHHTYVDSEKDPYAATRGFWWSHMGWVMRKGYWGNEDYNNVPDLRKDPVLRFQHDHYLLVALVVNLALVIAAGALTGRWIGMIVIAGFLRVVVVQHFTFCINSLAHLWGSQPWSSANTSKDNWALSLLTLGEGYHNYHHSFESDYRNGVRWYAYDPSKWLIWLLSKLGMSHDLKRTPEDLVLRKRFEEGQRTLSERLEAWGEAKADAWAQRMNQGRDELVARFEALKDQMSASQLELGESADEFQRRMQEKVAEWKGQLAFQAEDLRLQLLEQIRAAEEALEEALAELKVRRQELRRGGKTADRAQIREMKAALRRARASARAALRGWEQAVDRYREQFDALPATA